MSSESPDVLVGVSPAMTVSSADAAQMAAEMQRLDTLPGLLGFSSGVLEAGFRDWLNNRMRRLLSQYLWALLLMYVLLIAVSVPGGFWFEAEPRYTANMIVFGWETVALGLGMLVLFLAVRLKGSARLFRHGIVLACLILLTALGIGVLAFTGDSARIMAMANLWIAGTVVFSSGLLLPLTCLVIMLLLLPAVIGGCLMLGLVDGLWLYAWQMLVAGAFLLVFSFIMARVHRQVFLQEGILLHERQRLTELSEELAQLSLRDALTGVANRRRFDELLEREWGRSQRQRTPLALLFIDVDNFKAYNDHYGHQAGDDCLRAVAFVLVDAGRRQADLVARYGGEEFVLLLPDTDEAGAAEAAERIRGFLAQAGLPHEAVARGRVTASIGVAVCVPDASASPATLLAAADQALYQAKAGGRDRVVVAPRRPSGT